MCCFASIQGSSGNKNGTFPSMNIPPCPTESFPLKLRENIESFKCMFILLLTVCIVTMENIIK